MNQLFIFFVLFLSSFTYAHAQYNPADWIPLTKIFVSYHAPTQQQAVFVNTYTGVGAPPNQWNTVSVAGLVDPAATAINLTGILIITHGLSDEDANLEIFFRRTGETNDYLYTGQVIEPFVGGGQRSTMSCWVPLSSAQEFDFYFTKTNPGQWPTWSAYGINLSINAWGY